MVSKIISERYKVKKSELRLIIREMVVGKKQALKEDKEQKFWSEIFDFLEKQMPNYDSKKIKDYNKAAKLIVKHIGMSSNVAMKILIDYNNYKDNQSTKEQAIKNIIKLVQKYKNIRKSNIGKI